MKTWTQLRDREKLRIKADAARFSATWKAQIDSGKRTDCVQMLKSSICATKAHARVPIEQLSHRTGLSVEDIACFLHEHGDATSAMIEASCPVHDPLKQQLVTTLQQCEAKAAREILELQREKEARNAFRAASTVSLEHVRPWVLSNGFIKGVCNADRHYDPRSRQPCMNRARYAFEQLGNAKEHQTARQANSGGLSEVCSHSSGV